MKVGFIGLGNVGGKLANSLLRNKFDLTVIDLDSSLTKDSGQNPIEPARLGCKIFHGPYVSNFAEIYKYFNELGISKEVNSSNELSLSLVEEFKDNKPKNLEITEKIETYGQNILNNVTQEIKKYI